MEMCLESTVVRGCETLELVWLPAPVLQLLGLGAPLPTRTAIVTFRFLLMEAERLLPTPSRPPKHPQPGAGQQVNCDETQTCSHLGPTTGPPVVQKQNSRDYFL